MKHLFAPGNEHLREAFRKETDRRWVAITRIFCLSGLLYNHYRLYSQECCNDVQQITNYKPVLM